MKKLIYSLTAMILMASCTVAEQTEQQKQSCTTPIVASDTIQLQIPSKDGGSSINKALWARQSSREYQNVPLSLEELSGVLWAAAGINRLDGHHTSPSALSLYPIQTYAFLEGGVYLYNAKSNTLERKVEGDHRPLTAMQDYAYNASLNIVYVADLSVYEGQNIPTDKVLILCGMDAAGYTENVNLYAAGHGLKSITRGSAKADEILSLLQLDPSRYQFILAQTVGK